MPVGQLPPSEWQKQFPLEGPSWGNLRKYTQIRITIPKDLAAYEEKFGITQPTKDRLGTNILKISQIYGNIYEHCSTYENEIEPGVKALAQNISSYSTTAKAVYDEICKSIIKLEESKDVEKSEKTLNEALDYEVAQMDKMLQKATSVLEALKTFETDSIKDRDNIADEDRKLAAELLTIEAERTDADSKVKSKTPELEKAEKEEADARKRAAYHPPASASGSFGYNNYGIPVSQAAAQARELHVQVMTYRQQLGDATTILVASTQMKTQVSSMHDALGNITSLIGPAISTIGKMKDHIGTMKEDIKSAKDTVNTNLREARMEWMVNITHQQVEDSWSDLKKSASIFRDEAFTIPLD